MAIRTPRKKQTKLGYHHGNLREAILKESLLWIRKKGLESLSLREIAKILGVSHSAPNKHFPKKDALIASLIEKGFIEFKESLLRGLSSVPDDPKEAFMNSGREYLRFALSNPEMYKLMFSDVIANPKDYPEMEEAGNQAFSVLHQAISRLQDLKIIQAWDSVDMSLMIWSLSHGYSMLCLEGRISRVAESKNPNVVAEEILMERLLSMMGSGIMLSK